MFAGSGECNQRIPVVLADGSAVFLAIVLPYLETFPGLQVVGVARDGPEALKMALRLHPRLLMLDLQMPGMDGLTLIRQLRVQAPDVRIVIVTIHDTPRMRTKCLEAGADGFVGKHALHSELPEVLRSLYSDSALAALQADSALIHS